MQTIRRSIGSSPLFRMRIQPVVLLAIRAWLASQWLIAGWHKLVDPAWMDGTGRGLLKFWTTALGTTASGQPVITYDWYRGFIQFLVDSHAEGWFARLIAASEFAVGLGILFGAALWLSALGGLTLNTSYMLAGAVSTNPVLALTAGLLILAGKSAGSIGLDGFLRTVSLDRLPFRFVVATPVARTWSEEVAS